MAYKRLNTRGDTLIEVLLSIAVLSSIIGLSYGTAARAQRSTMLAQQRADSTSVAQMQLERLRAIRDQSGQTQDTFKDMFDPAYTAPGSAFCVQAGPAYTLVDANNPLSPCYFSTSTSGRFHAKVTFDKPIRLFRVTVTWQALGSGQMQSTIIEDRLW